MELRTENGNDSIKTSIQLRQQNPDRHLLLDSGAKSQGHMPILLYLLTKLRRIV
jgi:hypothetical protein